MTRTWLLGALVVGILGCDAPVETRDASVVNGLTPPTPPSLMRMACPANWEALSLPGGNSGCAPWPEVPTCAPGELLTAAGCEALSPSCALEGLTSAAIFVVPGAVDGDGSRERPFGTLTEALSRGTEIALAEGTYDIPGSLLLAGTRVIGACAGRTVIRVGRVRAEGAGNALRGVTLEPFGATPGLGVAVGTNGSLEMASVELRDFDRAIEVATNGSLVLRRVAAHDLLDLFVLGFDAARIDIAQCSAARTRAGAIATMHDAALPLLAEVRVVDTVLSDITDPSGLNGAIQIEAASLTVSNVIVENGGTSGVMVRHGVSQIDDVFVRGTSRIGLGVLEGTATTNRITMVETGGIFVNGTVTAADLALVRNDPPLVVRDTEGTFDRVVISEGRGTAVDSEGGQVTYRDLFIFDEADSPSNQGRGLQVRDGGQVRVERVHVERVRAMGIGVYTTEVGGPSQLTTSDVEVLDVASVGELDGMGLLSMWGSSLVAVRTHVARAYVAGVFVQGGAAELSELRVESISGPAFFAGSGILAVSEYGGESHAAQVVVRGAELVDLQGYGVLLAGRATHGDLEHLRISGVRRGACDEMACDHASGGAGIFSFDSNTVSVRDFDIEHAELAGVIGGFGVTLSLERGRIAHCPFGLLVSDVPFNLRGSPGVDVIDPVVFEDDDVAISPASSEILAVAAPEIDLPPSQRAP